MFAMSGHAQLFLKNSMTYSKIPDDYRQISSSICQKGDIVKNAFTRRYEDAVGLVGSTIPFVDEVICPLGTEFEFYRKPKYENPKNKFIFIYNEHK
jgi:hypothetical protein